MVLSETVEIPHFISAKTIKSDSTTHIPKKIYQTWKTRSVPRKVAENIYELLSNNPSYDYYLFGDDECREYLIQNYDKQYIDAFDDLIPGAFKADFWRYAILAKEGGVYIDLDMKLIKPIDYILSDSDFITVKDRVFHTGKYAIFQSFIATIPNHPFIIETLNYVLDNIQSHYHGKSALSITGPIAMGESLKRILKNPLRYGITEDERFGKYTILLWADTGQSLFENNGNTVIAETECIVDTDNVPVFDVGKIDGYEAHQSYATLFHNKQVYQSYELDTIDICFISLKKFFVDVRNRKIHYDNILLFILISFLFIICFKNFKKY